MTGTKEAREENALAGSATANANLSVGKRAVNYLKNKWYSMRRKHQRARDSFVNEQESFNQLSGWRKAKLIMSNPLAYIKSKTKSGKAATAKRNAEAAADDQLLDQLMNDSSQSASTAPAPAPSAPQSVTASEPPKRKKR